MKKFSMKSINNTSRQTKIKNLNHKIITVQNAEKERETTAEIIWQNHIIFKPKISVVIPVYNVEKYLSQCLDTIIAQTLKEIEIICVDDGSTDASAQILEDYAGKDSRITLLKQKNLRAGVARNAGLTIAQGEYVSFLDSDDFFEKNMLEKLYEKAKVENADIVMCDLFLYDEKQSSDTKAEWTLRCNTINKFHSFTYKDVPENIFNISNCWVWNRLYNRNFINKHNLRFQSLGCANDTFFSCIAQVLASKITYIPDRLIHYRINRINAGNVTSVNFRKKHPEDLLNCFAKIHSKLINLKIYDSVKLSFLRVAVEHIYWSRSGLIDNAQCYKMFKTYFSRHYKNIFDDLTLDTHDNILKRKYAVLRNILVDCGVFKEIPKRIFYVWGFNEPKKDEVIKCIKSWQEHLPDYEIVEINDKSTEYFNFEKELKKNKWFRTIYIRKMWAYVADYIRCKALYENGGIYFDTDVSVVQNMDKFLKNPAFVGMQRSSLDGNGDWVEPAVCGAQQHNSFFKKIINFYNTLIWKKDIYTMPQIFDYYLRSYDIYPFPAREKQKIIRLKDIYIYPEHYFIPYRFRENFTNQCVKSNTHTIHWWSGSWVKEENLKFLQFKNKLGWQHADETTGTSNVSVIICAYNSEKFLAKCLNSIISQTLKNIEIICVNDGSSDSTLQILKQYANIDKRIRIISQKNQGLSVSRNNAMRIAKGKYIAFVDADDWLRSDCLEYLYRWSQYHGLDMLSFGGINYNNSNQALEHNPYYAFEYLPAKWPDVFNFNDCRNFIEKMAVSSCLTFYNFEFLKKNRIKWIGKKVYYEDNLFFTESLLKAERVSILKDKMYFRTIHNECITQNLDKHFFDFMVISEKVLELVSRLTSRDILNSYFHKYTVACYRTFQGFSISTKRKYEAELKKFLNKVSKKYEIPLPMTLKSFVEKDYVAKLLNAYVCFPFYFIQRKMLQKKYVELKAVADNASRWTAKQSIVDKNEKSEKAALTTKQNTYYIVSGGFDPIHEGHIELIKASAAASDGVIVLVNSDEWLVRKKGKAFQTFNTRKTICENLKGVIEALGFNDDDDSASDGIRRVREKYPEAHLVFANGGDRGKDNIREDDVCKECRIDLAFGVGGENKANSSSWILKKWKD